MAHHQHFTAIIVAGGTGTRCNNDMPKQYTAIAGQTILEHTLEVFQSMPQCNDICVVIHPEHETLFKSHIGDNVRYCFGGTTRQESVYNSLCAMDLNDDALVLIHDAARPFVRQSDIHRLIDAMENTNAATLAVPVADTLCYEHNDKQIMRENLWAIQTPQAFRYGLIKKAHESHTSQTPYTDDTTLIATYGETVKFIHGSKENFKITYPDDLTMAQKMLSHTTQFHTHIGTGFDVHAFDPDKNAKFVTLCGVQVPHTHSLKGHSDADVGLHALTDAVLGAIGEGDIGLHFPPSDDTFKNMDSAIFLEHAIKLMQEKGGVLVNADVTLICERPKIGAYRDAMVSRMAHIMNIPTSRINIKATTTEKLGFTGRSEGIAAQASVSVQLPCNNHGEQA